MAAQPFSGVLAPVLTPFNDDLTIADDLYVAHAKWLLKNGCSALAPFGTTSEANSLGIDERIATLEALTSAGVPAAKLMVGTGTCALPDTVRLTRHAVELGAGGVLLLPPFYYKGVSDEGIFRSIAAVIEGVIESVGCGDLRIYLYHFPAMAVVAYSTALMTRLAGAFPGIVVGTKDSSGDMENTMATHAALPGFGTFVGMETYLLENLRAGGAGCVTATANVNPAAIDALYRGWQGPDVDALDKSVCEYRLTVQDYPVIPAMKWLIADRLGEPRWRNVRPPLLAFSDAEGAALKGKIEALQ